MISKPLRSGGSVEGSVTHRRDETNSTFATLNPSYRTGVAVTLRKPLLRGHRLDGSRRSHRLTRLGLEEGRWSLRAAVLDTLAVTERAYWTLAEARRRRDVSRLSLEEARTLLGTSRARVEAGALAPIDVVEAEAAVTERRASLVQALRTLAEAETALLRRLAPELGAGQRPPPLADRPGANLPPAPPLEEVLRRALERNPRYRLARLDLETQEVELRFARDALLPQLDVVATLQANGVRGDLGPSFEDVAQVDFPRYFVGLAWEVPLGRRRPRAEHARQRTLVEAAVRRLKSQELTLRTEAETALRRYRVDLAGMDVAAARVEAAGRKLEAEEARYEEGLITADDLLRFQRELAEARSAEVSARAQTARTALDLWVVTGTLAQERGVAEREVAWQG